MPRDRLIKEMRRASKLSAPFSLRLTLLFIGLHTPEGGIYTRDFSKFSEFRDLKKGTYQKHLDKLCSLGFLHKIDKDHYQLMEESKNG